MDLKERIYLLFAAAIVAHQMIVGRGHFDPVAVGLVGLLLGLVPASQIDTRARRRRDEEAELEEREREREAEREFQRKARDVLDQYLKTRGDGE